MYIWKFYVLDLNMFQSLSRSNPYSLIGISTGVTALASVRFGRFALIRNTVFATIFSYGIVNDLPLC